MEINLKEYPLVSGGLLTGGLLAMIAPIFGAPITWEPTKDITDPTVVIAERTLIEAINATRATGIATVNGVDFSPSNTLLPGNAATGVLAGATTLDTGLDSLLNNVEFGGGSSTSITVGGGNLVVGQSYLIQLFYTDLRNDRTMTFGDGEGNTVDVQSKGAPGTFGQYTIGFFEADDTSQSLNASITSGNSYISGYQIRNAAPPPTINQFTATPALITRGESTTLNWQITGAISAELSQGVGFIDPLSGNFIVSPSATTTYTLTATNKRGSVTSEITVGVDEPIIPPVLSEFLASNESEFTDEDGNSSDWIEIYNPNLFALDLEGYHLSDDIINSTRWTFPEKSTIAGESYLIVFATGTSRNLPELHTDFKISAKGGYLALLSPDHSTVISEFNYPAQRTNFSYGAEGYFVTSTPGDANGIATNGFVADTIFDIDRGFYDTAFDVNITTDTQGATIIYTTDGTEPTLTNGTSSPSSASVPITGTTVLRAAAYKTGFIPTNIDTQTYLFTSDIIQQSEMDPDVVNDSAYRGEIASAMKSIRALSIVTHPDHLFDNATGILENTQGRGSEWERPISMEFIDAHDAENSTQTNAGLRVHGNGSRSNAKNSLRLLFRSDYGSKKLNYPLFGDDFITEKFNTVVLRAQNANSWTRNRPEDRQSTTFLQDSFAKDTQGAMGQPHTGSTFVHLFLNGTYWGLYNPTERPDGSFGEDHFGGDDTDYDAVNRRFSVEVLSGTKTHWDEMISYTNNLLDTQAEYEGLHEYVDIENLIDYMLIHQYMQARDGPDDFGHNNMRLVRRNNPPGPWQAYSWDMEYSMIDTNGTRDYSYPFPIYSSPRSSSRDISDSIASIYLRAKDNNPEFQLHYADRAYKHLFNDGALTPANASARFEARALEIESAVIGESARWGDHERATPYTRNTEWTTERNRINNQFFPARPDHVISQLRIHGLYPSIDPPIFSQHGGEVARGFDLELSSPTGRIYYTTDHSDPREKWTDNPLGSTYSTALGLTQSITIKARTLHAEEWSALTEATFIVGTPANSTNLIVSELNYHPPVGEEGREFIELLNISSETIDLSGASFSEGISFTFPQNTTLPAGSRLMVVNDQAAFTLAEQTHITGTFQDDTKLANDGERITLIDYLGDTIVDFSYGDDNDWPTFPDGNGPSLTLIDPANSPNLSDPASWRPSVLPGGSPAVSDSTNFLGDPLGDDNENGIPNLIEYATGSELSTGFLKEGLESFFTISFRQNLGADDVILIIESSNDLDNWSSSPLHSSSTYHGDGTSSVTWRAHDSIVASQPKQFLRVRAIYR